MSNPHFDSTPDRKLPNRAVYELSMPNHIVPSVEPALHRVCCKELDPYYFHFVSDATFFKGELREPVGPSLFRIAGTLRVHARRSSALQSTHMVRVEAHADDGGHAHVTACIDALVMLSNGIYVIACEGEPYIHLTDWTEPV